MCVGVYVRACVSVLCVCVYVHVCVCVHVGVPPPPPRRHPAGKLSRVIPQLASLAHIGLISGPAGAPTLHSATHVSWAGIPSLASPSSLSAPLVHTQGWLPSVWPASPPTTTPNALSAGLLLSPASEVIPKKLVDKIWAYQFIEMRELLSDNISLLA